MKYHVQSALVLICGAAASFLATWLIYRFVDFDNDALSPARIWSAAKVGLFLGLVPLAMGASGWLLGDRG
jgi:hypothetical protein